MFIRRQMVRRIAKPSFVYACYLLMMMAALSVIWAEAAIAGTLSSRSDLVTDPSPSATTSHQFTFTTATTGTIASVTFTFPSGFNVTGVSLGLTSGIGAGTVSADTSLRARYTVTSPASVNAGTAITIQLQGVVNSASTGSKSISIATKNASDGTIDSGTVSTVINNATSISSSIQQVFVFTVGTGSLTFSVDPASSPVAATNVTLTVETNTSSASGGYRVTSRIGQQLTGTAYSAATIPPWTGTTASPTTWNTTTNPNYWGVTRSAFPNDSGNYFGVTTTAQTVMSGTGPTNGDSQTETWKVAVDYTTPADTYTTTIYFVGTPSF